MAFGRNDLITRAYAESMINRSNRGISEQVKSIQEQVVALNIDFAGFQEKLKQLEQPNAEIQTRLNELIHLIESKKFITGVIQSESGTRLNSCQDSLMNDDSLGFFASGDKLPVAINHLILEVLKYVLNGKQD